MINYISPFIISITLQESSLACRWGEPSHSAINCELKQIDGHRFSLFSRSCMKTEASENICGGESQHEDDDVEARWENWNVNTRLRSCLFISPVPDNIYWSRFSAFVLIFLAVLKCDSHRLRIALIKHLPLLSRLRTPLFTFRLYCPKKRRSRLPGSLMNVRRNESRACRVYIAIMNLVSRVNEPTWRFRATFLIAIEKAVANIIAARLIALLSKFHLL